MEQEKYFNRLMDKFNKKSSNAFIIYVAYTNQRDMVMSLIRFNDSIGEYVIRKIRDDEDFPDNGGIKEVLVTKIDYEFSLFEKIYYWWNNFIDW